MYCHFRKLYIWHYTFYSERAESTGATGDRLKEGAAINQSLSCLGNCIAALADNAGGKKTRGELFCTWGPYYHLRWGCLKKYSQTCNLYKS